MDTSLDDKTSSEGTINEKGTSKEWVEKPEDWVGEQNVQMGDEIHLEIGDQGEDNSYNGVEQEENLDMNDKSEDKQGDVEDGDACEVDEAAMNDLGESIENAENIVVKVEEDEGDEQDDGKQVEEKFDIEVKKETDIKHPYKDLLDNYKVSDGDLEPVEKIEVVALKKAQHFFITTKASLMEIIEQLSSKKAVGVICRYNTHNYYSRLCVLQLSAGPFHYLIDCIKLEPHLHILSDLFGDPKIVKVVNGSQYMFKRLQLDHNLYFVNVFDTSMAMKMLGWRKETYRHFVENKYKVPIMNKDIVKNLTRWHLRPLPEDYIDLIVTDGNYLVPTYLLLKKKLIERKLMEPLLLKLNDQCKNIYKESNILEDTFQIPYLKPSQVDAIYALEEWRHALGYKRKKNVNLILSWKSFRLLIEKMPTKKSEILKILNTEPAANKFEEVQKIIMKAVKVIGPINSKDGINIGVIEDNKSAGAAGLKNNKRPLNVKGEEPTEKKARDQDVGTLKKGPTGNKINTNKPNNNKGRAGNKPQNQGINKAKNKFQPKMSAGKKIAIRKQVITNTRNKGPANQGPRRGPAIQSPRSGPANRGAKSGPANRGARSGPYQVTVNAQKRNRNNKKYNLGLRDNNDRYRMTDSGRGMNVDMGPPIWDSPINNLKNIWALQAGPELPSWNLASVSESNFYTPKIQAFEMNRFSDIGTSSRFETTRPTTFRDIEASRTGHFKSRSSSNNQSFFDGVDMDFDVRRQNDHIQRNGNARDKRGDVVSYPQYNPSRYNTQGYR